jgi:PEGA domain
MLLPTGCVRRRLAVRSNPPGALVFVDNQQIGTTPCSVDFTYYGTREIRLVKPGYETLTVNQPIPTPWYQIPPIDFVSENLVPSKILDHRTAAFQMQPQLIVPTDQLLDRANQLRQVTLESATVPAASVAIPNATAPWNQVPIGSAPLNTVPLSPVPAGPPAGTAPIGSPFDAPQPMPQTPTPLPPTSSVAPPPTFSPPPMP